MTTLIPDLFGDCQRLREERDQARRIAIEFEQRIGEALRLLGEIRGTHSFTWLVVARVLRGDDDE